MWRFLRIVFLLMILAAVIGETIAEKNDLDWKKKFYVAVYLVNADDSAKVSTYLPTLTQGDFEPIAEYFATEAASYGVNLRNPVAIQLGGMVQEIPPAPPKDGSVLSTILWSLKFRYFAWQNSPKTKIKPNIRLYLLYYDPVSSPRLGHSTALNKGRIGRVNLFGEAAYAKQNLVIVAHELLHTLNATDKYDLATTLPSFPEGYAEPDKQPLYPQQFVEIMGGRVPISAQEARIPKSLNATLVGEKTAYEIGWLKP